MLASFSNTRPSTTTYNRSPQPVDRHSPTTTREKHLSKNTHPHPHPFIHKHPSTIILLHQQVGIYLQASIDVHSSVSQQPPIPSTTVSRSRERLQQSKHLSGFHLHYTEYSSYLVTRPSINQRPSICKSATSHKQPPQEVANAFDNPSLRQPSTYTMQRTLQYPPITNHHARQHRFRRAGHLCERTPSAHLTAGDQVLRQVRPPGL
jgi:hypothetical protein